MSNTILRFKEIDSTNAYAIRNFTDMSDGTVICAEMQTAGRGRMDRKWLSEGKGIYFTIILKKAESAAICAAFSHLMSISVCEALRGIGLFPQIKWPNDVLCSASEAEIPGKICGILSQAYTGRHGLEGIALGTGINHSQNAEDFAGVMYPAASISMLMGKAEIPSKDDILKSVLEHFFKRKNEFEKQGFASIRNEYIRYCHFLGKSIKISVNGGKETVLAKEINPDGTLTIISDGTEKTISAADILYQ